MKNITTSSGFECAVNEDARRDWRIVDALADAQSDSLVQRLKGLQKLCKLLIGEDGYSALQKVLAEPNGTVDMHAMEREIVEIFKLLGDGSGETSKN